MRGLFLRDPVKVFRGLFSNLRICFIARKKDPLRLSSKLPGGLKLENCTLVVGVEVVISGLAIVSESGEKGIWRFVTFFILPNPLVIAQKRKFARMEPCGEPPGAVLGLDFMSLIFTLIFCTLRKAWTKPTDSLLAPRPQRAWRHFEWSIR